MIIDTEKLVEFINKRDDILHPNVNWDTCSMKLIDLCEKKAVESMELVEKIEILVNEMNQLVKPEQNTENGFIILNKETGEHGWDDNTEFHPDKDTAIDRIEELEYTAGVEKETLEIVPATLIYNKKPS